MKSITTILVFFIFMASCHKDDDTDNQTDENGVITSLSYQWKKSLHNGDTFNSNGRIKSPIYYNGNIAIPTTNGENSRFLTMINPTNGETIWQWNDNYLPYSNQISISYYYQYNNLLTYQTGTNSYCVNLDNGTTQWKFQRNKPYDVRINTYNNSYFGYSAINNQEGNDEQICYQGNLQTGELTEFLRANLSSNYISPTGIGGIIYVNQIPNQENNLLVTYAEPLPDNEVNSFIGIYNTVNDSWVWDRKLLSSPNINTSVFSSPQIYNGKVIANVGKKLVCHSLETGEQIWRKPFPQDFLFSGFIIEDDKIIANNEDTFTYCLNPENGNIIWKTESSGTSGRMSYLNGIVYFVGGSTGKLHAIDVSNGEHVWKINAGNLGESGSSSFKTNAVYVFEAENGNPAKIIALSHLNAYSFEAYQ